MGRAGCAECGRSGGEGAGGGGGRGATACMTVASTPRRGRATLRRRSLDLAADPACEPQVLLLDRDPLGVDGAQVGVGEETDEVRLGRLL